MRRTKICSRRGTQRLKEVIKRENHIKGTCSLHSSRVSFGATPHEVINPIRESGSLTQTRGYPD